jgi:hypothetical protein
MSWRTNASRSAGSSASRITSSARPTESANSASCWGLLPSAGSRFARVRDRPGAPRGKAAVLAHRLARPLAAEWDEHRQRGGHPDQTQARCSLEAQGAVRLAGGTSSPRVRATLPTRCTQMTWKRAARSSLLPFHG